MRRFGRAIRIAMAHPIGYNPSWQSKQLSPRSEGTGLPRAAPSIPAHPHAPRQLPSTTQGTPVRVQPPPALRGNWPPASRAQHPCVPPALRGSCPLPPRERQCACNHPRASRELPAFGIEAALSLPPCLRRCSCPRSVSKRSVMIFGGFWQKVTLLGTFFVRVVT